MKYVYLMKIDYTQDMFVSCMCMILELLIQVQIGMYLSCWDGKTQGRYIIGSQMISMCHGCKGYWTSGDETTTNVCIMLTTLFLLKFLHQV